MELNTDKSISWLRQIIISSLFKAGTIHIVANLHGSSVLCLCRIFAIQVIFPTEYCWFPTKAARAVHVAHVHVEVQHSLGYRTHPWETSYYLFSGICFFSPVYLNRIALLWIQSKVFPNVARNSKVLVFFPFSLGCMCHVLLQVRRKERENRNMFPVLGPQDEQVDGHPIQTHKHI